VPIGGGLAFDALTACRKVQLAAQVDPSVSAVEVTVNVIAGAAVGVGVDASVPSGVTARPVLRPPLLAEENEDNDERVSFVTCLGSSPDWVWPKTARAKDTPLRQSSRTIKAQRDKNAD
jgi:hypothetical protein